MSTPAEQVTAAAAALPAALDGMDAPQRVKVLGDFADAARSAMVDAGALRGAAMRELVERVGATKAARELGLSRQMVYKILGHDKQPPPHHSARE